MRHAGKRLAALVLALALLLSACKGKKNAAATMHLVRTEGTVQVKNEKGKSVKPAENLGLYSGYGVTTQSESYGWINLDDTKLAKMDASSEVEIRKDGKMLELNVLSGNLFFDISKPLEDDETLNIRTSTMVVGIRGTCGWVEVEDTDVMCVYLLKGEVECSALDDEGEVLASESIAAGEAAMMEADGTITVAEFDTTKLPNFVEAELDGPIDLPERFYDTALRALAEVCVLYAQDSTDIAKIANQVDRKYKNEHFSIEFSRLPTVHRDLGGRPETTLDSYSYAYYDLDGDGTEELWLSHDGELALMYYIHYPNSGSSNEAERGIRYVVNADILQSIYGGEAVISTNGSIVMHSKPTASGSCTISQWQFPERHNGYFKAVYMESGSNIEGYNKMLNRCGGERTGINFRWHPLSDFA